MAPRLLYGSKPSRDIKSRSAAPPAEKPSGLPRKSGIPAPPSRLPTTGGGSSVAPAPSAPSSLPRGRPKNVDDRRAPRSQIPSATSTSSAERTPLRAPVKKSDALTPGTSALASPAGMGTFTEISSSNTLPQRNRLRRKPSSQNQRALYAQAAPSDSSINAEPRQGAPPAPTMSPPFEQAAAQPLTSLDSGLPQAGSIKPPTRYMTTTPTEFATSNSRMMSYVSRHHPQKGSTSDLSHSGASAGRSSTPSTRLSESPGNFSRTSTPTSASSQSPSLMQAPKFGARARPSISPSTTRPPVTRAKMAIRERTEEEYRGGRGLPAVRESQTSSSSSSTVKGVDHIERPAETKAQSKKSKLRQPAPTPPLRLSSKRGPHPESLASAISPSEAPRAAAPASRLARPTLLPAASSATAATPRVSSEAQRTMPPRRPSREGTPALENANLDFAVIQSNLSQFTPTSGQRRRDSLQRTTPSTSASHSARPSLSRSTSVTSAGTADSIPAPALAPSASSPHLIPRINDKGQPPLAMRTDLKEPPSKRDPSPMSASPSRSIGRFGLFSRKLKSPSETSIASPPKPDKLVKRGPAAGTGHEGYGRYARRGRSTSVGTNTSRGRSASNTADNPMPRPSTSRKSSFNNGESKSELDEFYKDRLEPITIGGGGQVRENRNSQTSLYQSASAQSSVGSFESSIYATSRDPRPFEVYSAEPSSLASSQQASYELLPAPRLISTPQGIVQQERSLAHRRSLHRSQMGGSHGVPIPAPIDTNVSAASPAIDTYDSTLSSVAQTETSLASEFSEGHEGNWLRAKKKTPDRTKSPRKWNIFRRQHRSPERSHPVPATPDEYERAPMQAEVASAYEPAPVAHYALMDELEDQPEQDMEEALQNIEGNLEFDSEIEAEVSRYRERQPSALLPSPPLFSSEFEDQSRVASPKVALNTAQSPQSATPALRPSRLQQVGRIPQVVSNRKNLHTPASHSFSRPFASQSGPETPASAQPAFGRPILGLQTDPLPSAQWFMTNPASAPPANCMLYNFEGEEEFLRMSPPKDSELTTSSSSSGILSLAPVTAITPSADAMLGDDEVWGEYDELLDRVSPPILSSPDYATPIDLWSSFPDLAKTLSTPDTDYLSAIPIALAHVTSGAGKANTSSTARFAPAGTQGEYLAAPGGAFSNGDSLNSPISLSDLYSNYGNRSVEARSIQRLSNVSATSGSRYSSNTIISESESPLSLETPEAKRVTQVIAQKTAHASSDSLRFSALMTSRWLSFDRVLFSPAQEEVLNSRQTRILVLDGLGNDDWSAYCALTYSDATVYNLSSVSRRLNSKDTSNSDSWTPPPNLRRMSHAGIGAPFPFPKGFFTAVVFRFPAADTPSAYKNAISECKRVLKPGGYLELCILDIDMMNTGPRARRAIRSVKESMQSATPDVSLSPASDTVIKLLGRRGFENLNRCFVGVPLADAATSPNGTSTIQPQAETEVSRGSKNFRDLLAGHEDQDARRNGPKMMGRVGRWWWTRCYEKEVLRDGEKSLWDDRQLAAECEERQTSLRLVICCAQKPESVRRRTVSV